MNAAHEDEFSVEAEVSELALLDWPGSQTTSSGPDGSVALSKLKG